MAQSPVKTKAAKTFDDIGESFKALKAKSQQRSLSTPPTMIEVKPATATTVDAQNQIRLEPQNPTRPDQLTSEAAALRERTEAKLQQFWTTQRSLSPAKATEALGTLHHSERNTNNSAEFMKRMEMLALRSNQLSSLQETTLRELKTIAHKLERDWQATQAENQSSADSIPTLCNYESVIVPYIEKDDRGAFVVKTRSIDLLQAEREAAQIAQRLRDRQESSTGEDVRPVWSGASQEWERWSRVFRKISTLVKRRFTRQPNRRSAQKATRVARATQPNPLTLGDMVVWVAGAVLVRIGINALIATYPGLWFPVIGLIVAPAAIAVYRITVMPQSGYLWGYRLFLIMVGLLIGGRV